MVEYFFIHLQVCRELTRGDELLDDDWDGGSAFRARTCQPYHERGNRVWALEEFKPNRKYVLVVRKSLIAFSDMFRSIYPILFGVRPCAYEVENVQHYTRRILSHSKPIWALAYYGVISSALI